MCDIGHLSSSGWQSVKPELRWTKNRKPILQAVSIGSTVRAEIVDAVSEPTGFRVWRSVGVVSRLFTRFLRPKPLFLRVGGWEGGLVYSEDLNTGSALTWKSERYEFDPNSAKPRSLPLPVVPHTKIERLHGGSAVASAEIAASSDFVPAKAGTKFRLGSTRSTRWVYDLTAAVDPELEARVLAPWTGGDNELADHLVELLTSDAAEAYSMAPESFREEASDFLRSLVSENQPVAARFELSRTHFSMAEGERQSLLVTVDAEHPGIGLFAIQLVDEAGLTSTSDPWLYVVSEYCEAITLYDAVVKDLDDQTEEGAEVAEAPVSPADLAGQSLPIPGERIDVGIVFATPEEESKTGRDEEMTAGA